MFGRESGSGWNPFNKESKQNKTEDPKEPIGQPVKPAEKIRNIFSRKKHKIDQEERRPQESKESVANHSSPAEVLTGELLADSEAPKYIIDDLKKPKIILKVHELINNRAVFGQKLKKTWETVRPGLAGAAAGAAMRSATKFALKRTLDFGSVGASAVAGGLVGGGMEFYKANKAEKQRLNNLDTYNKTLDGYEKMTDLEKASAYVALEAALKDRNLDPTVHAELSARMLELKVSADKKDAWEKNDKSERLLKLFELRQNAEFNLLEKGRSKEEAKILNQLYKEQGLAKNWKKITLATAKGAVIGAGAGALGAWVFEHFSGSAVQTVADRRPGGLSQAAAPRFIPPLETAKTNLPSKEDVQTLHKTVWHTAKQFLQDHGIKKPSVKDINQAMVTISEENNIEITGHHPGALGSTWYEGFEHAHKEGAGALKDTHLQEGMKLKGFDKLAELVKKAGGHIAVHQEVPVAAHNELVGKVPVSGMGNRIAQTMVPRIGLNGWTKDLGNYGNVLKSIFRVSVYVAEVAAVGAGSAYAGNELYKKIKNLRTKENLKSEEAARPEPKQEVLPKVIPIDSMPKAEKTEPSAVEPKKDSASPEIFTAGAVLATREAGKNPENLTLEELEKKIAELSNNTNKALDDVETYLNEPNPDYFEYDDMLDKAWNYLTNDNWEKITGAVSEENPQTILTLEKLWNDSVKNLMERRAKITDKAEKIFNLNSEPIPDNFSGDLPADDGGDDDNKKEENKIEILGKNNEQLPAEPILDMGRRVEMLDEIVTKQSSSFDKVFEYLQRPDATLQGFRDMDAKIELVFTPEFGKKLTSGATEEEISKLNKLGNKALDFLNTKWDGIAALADEKFFISNSDNST